MPLIARENTEVIRSDPREGTRIIKQSKEGNVSQVNYRAMQSIVVSNVRKSSDKSVKKILEGPANVTKH